MPNAFVNAETELETLAEKALAFVSRADDVVVKKAPAAIAGLGVVLGAVDTALEDVEAVAKNPTQALSIGFDQQTLADLKAVWPDVKKFAADLGIKIGAPSAPTSAPASN